MADIEAVEKCVKEYFDRGMYPIDIGEEDEYHHNGRKAVCYVLIELLKEMSKIRELLEKQNGN